MAAPPRPIPPIERLDPELAFDSLEQEMDRIRAYSAAVAGMAIALASPAPAQTVIWNALSPATPFPQRAATASAYDPVSGALVVFGGFDSSSYSSETWAFAGGNWTLLSPASSPTARAGASMAYDSVKKQLILFGGFDGFNYLGDTWIFDGSNTTWTQATPIVSPPAVTEPMAFTDPSNGHAAVFGGFDGKFYQLTTYRWTGTNWRKLNPTNSPGARSSAVVALDPVHANVVMYGGLGSVRTDNTWLWDGTNWTEPNLLLQPALRYDSKAAFEPHLGAVVLFAGGSGGTDLNDTWKWDGSLWRQLAPTQAPPVRESFVMAYDGALDRVVVAGGDDGASFLTDTWEFVDEGAFVDLGPGIGGSLGAPTLAGSGDLSPGSATGFTLSLDNALPSSPALMVVSTTASALPFKGGTLYPFPIVLLVPLVTDPAGHALFFSAMPAGTPSGTDVVLQTWLFDASAPKGASGTNGLEAQVP